MLKSTKHIDNVTSVQQIKRTHLINLNIFITNLIFFLAWLIQSN